MGVGGFSGGGSSSTDGTVSYANGSDDGGRCAGGGGNSGKCNDGDGNGFMRLTQ